MRGETVHIFFHHEGREGTRKLLSTDLADVTDVDKIVVWFEYKHI
jgi:hypothetical protein